jgi:hypothetical protein
MSFQPAHKPIDQLVQSNRIKGASRIIPDDTLPDAVNDEQSAAVVQSVLDYISAAGMSRSAVARSIGLSPTVVGLVLSLTYKGNQKQILIDLDLWLESQIRRDEAPKVSSFVWTKVAEEIRTIADVASTLKTIGLVYGPESSGFGKTMALEAIAAIKPGAVLVTVEKVSATASGLVASIAHAMKISPGNTRYAWSSIKAALAGTSRLLIVDQIHALCGHSADKPLYVLADLFDATGAPQLWCGTSDIVAYLTRGLANGKEPLAQIRRRIGIARDLCERTRPGDGGPGEPLYSIEEVRQIFSRGKMRLTPEAVRYLMQLANTRDSGALGTCANLISMATALNERTATALTADMLKDAHRLLVSRSTFAATENAMQDAPARKATA